MRKSFGGSYGSGRTFGRVLTTRVHAFQDPFPSSSSSSAKESSSTATTRTRKTKITTSKRALSLSSPTPSCSPSSYLISNNDNERNEAIDNEDDEWECLENFYDPVFGVVPSTHEVQHALFSLQQALNPLSNSQFTREEIPCDVDKHMDDQTSRSHASDDMVHRTSSIGSSLDWIEPSMQPYDQRLAESYGWERVCDAFHLLQTEPSVQRMVVSLSSDKAVWDAVLNNDALREIRGSYRNAAKALPPSFAGNPDPSKTHQNVLKWIFDNMKVKLLQVIGNITQFMGDVFKPHDKAHTLSEKLKSTFLLTVVVLLIVVVTRVHKA